MSRVCLVAMPWSTRDRPSAAIGALTAWLRRDGGGVTVEPRSEFARVSALLGPDLYDRIALNAYGVGELLYMAVLYPERAERVREVFVGRALQDFAGRQGLPGPDPAHWSEIYDHVRGTLEAHLDGLVEALVGARLVGFTCCFGQVFSSLAVAQRLKRRSPGTVIVLGGSTVSSRVGPSLLMEYPFVDYVVQGEGERPLSALVRGEEPEAGLVSRANVAAHPNGVALDEVPDMGTLPYPDFDEYVLLADSMDIGWSLPIEGSRGCWWDRTKRTGNPKDTCHFCNLNVQWGGYREKPVERLIAELDALTLRYRSLRIFFLDNILRFRGADRLGEGIAALGRDYQLFYEMRASIRPIDFLRLWQAGLRSVQLGIEGLSSSYLRRVGKGTTVIQNLQAMRLCAEFRVINAANMIMDYPGATQEEVDETCRVIHEYALSFGPLEAVPFRLAVDATNEGLAETLGLRNIRNADVLRAGLPDDVVGRLRLFDLDFDPPLGAVSWDPVRQALTTWQQRYAAAPGPMLRYYDGGSFLVVEDLRAGDFRSGLYSGAARELYLACTRIRSKRELVERFPNAEAIIGQFVEERIAFEEGGSVLSLAIAATPVAAARRIEADATRT